MGRAEELKFKIYIWSGKIEGIEVNSYLLTFDYVYLNKPENGGWNV